MSRFTSEEREGMVLAYHIYEELAKEELALQMRITARAADLAIRAAQLRVELMADFGDEIYDRHSPHIRAIKFLRRKFALQWWEIDPRRLLPENVL